MSDRKTVVIGLLGTTLDRAPTKDRWNWWRPTVSIGQHDDFLTDRLELLVQKKYLPLAKEVAQDFHQVSPETAVNLQPIEFSDPWDFETVYAALLDFARGYPFDTDHEDYYVHITTGSHVMQICLFLLTESRLIPAKILQTGARQKTDAAGQLSIIDLDLSRYDKLAQRFETARREGVSFLKAGIETKNAAFNAMIDDVTRVCTVSDDPILLTGASGVGKTRLAHLIYDWKVRNRRVSGKLVEVNCATLRGDAAMSTLFGHKKGAFTGAVENRTGLLAVADGGLLFLDEIEALGIDEQAMLLRAIEEKRFYPVGSDKEVSSNFQLICGTNRDLTDMVRAGAFRSDLLARIDLWSFRLPSLKERPEDIEPNLAVELDRASERFGKRVRMNAEAKKAFLKAATAPDALWSGNFRDLAGAAVRMAVLSESGRITEAVAAAEAARLKSRWQAAAGGSLATDDEALVREALGDAAAELDRFDVVQLADVIRVCRESKTLSDAGRALFAQSLARRKSTNDSDRLRKYLGKFGLSWEKVQTRG